MKNVRHVARCLVLAATLLAQFRGAFVQAADLLAIDRGRAVTLNGDENLWYDIRDLGVEGRGWTETKEFYDRLPAKAEGVVRDPVWGLSRHSAGMCVRFVSDATSISARWTLRNSMLAMPHMPATGVSGLDLYARNDQGAWRWLSVGRPAEFPTNQQILAAGLPAGKREFLLYLPLYNGVESVQIGIPSSATLYQAPKRAADSKPIVFYGTSIMQGGCASRPGMAHAAILGRWLERETINLGFSGNGKMEQEMAALLAEIDAGAYVIDCLPNMSADEVTVRVEPLVNTIRKAHPQTPIVLVEDRSYSSAPFLASLREHNLASRAALRAAYERLLAAGVSGLLYVEGESLLGDDDEGTVDGSHPTDLGFLRMAQAMRPVLEKATGAP